MVRPNERYVVDADGQRIAVLLDIDAYERLMNELAVLRGDRSGQDLDEADGAGASRKQSMIRGDEPVSDAAITYHPRSPDASIERLRGVMGIVALNEHVRPRSWRLFEDDNLEDDARD